MRYLFRFAVALVVAAPVFAQLPSSTPVLPSPVPPPAITAKSYLLIDLTSRQSLLAQNAEVRREPAALTKLMTAYVAFQALRQKQVTLTQIAKVSENAAHAPGSRMSIAPDRTVTVDELLRGMIILSGDDAAVALAETIAGSEEAFAARMNLEAQRLGMSNAHFVNATGASDPRQYASAYDLALLTAAIIRDFPEYYPIYGSREFRYRGVAQYNRNRLLWRASDVDGVGTAYSAAAGYCLVVSAKRGPRRLLSVVLGSGSDSVRTLESQRLLDFGFQFYDAARLYDKNQPVANFTVWKGAAKTVPASFVEDQYVALPKGQIDKLKVSLDAAQPLVAPISKGQRVGVLKAAFDGKPLADYPLYALDDVAAAGWFVRAWDSARMLFSK